MNKTVSGTIQRVFLEETKTKLSDTETAPHHDHTVPSDNNASGTDAHAFLIPLVISAPSNHNMWEMQVMAWFWESYAPATRSSNLDADVTHWIQYALAIPLPTPPLKQALIALSTTRYGRVSGNPDAVTKGQHMYGKALALLQQALYDEQLMGHDETLASVRAMVLYEVRLQQSRCSYF